MTLSSTVTIETLRAGVRWAEFDREDEGEERVHQAYGVNYRRLAAVKAQYDPKNLFHLNATIKPGV